jgi:hypothetical protein
MRELSKSGAHAFGRAGHFFRGDREFLAEMQLDRDAALERAGANFWSLQIGDDGDRFFVMTGSTTNRSDTSSVLFGRPVRKIQARDIHSGADEVID